MRYSDRKRLAEEGTLGDLTHDRVSDEMGVAVRALMESAHGLTRKAFSERVTNAAIRHFGIGQPWGSYIAGGMDPDSLLDLVEIAAEEAAKTVMVVDPERGGRRVARVPIPDFERDANRIFERFRIRWSKPRSTTESTDRCRPSPRASSGHARRGSPDRAGDS